VIETIASKRTKKIDMTSLCVEERDFIRSLIDKISILLVARSTTTWTTLTATTRKYDLSRMNSINGFTLVAPTPCSLTMPPNQIWEWWGEGELSKKQMVSP